MRIIKADDLFDGNIVEFVTPERYKNIIEGLSQDTKESRKTVKGNFIKSEDLNGS